MKTFESDNYYDILQIAPDADQDAIRHAYRQASTLYDAQSVATYALFTDRQRETLLAAIEKAFETLIDDDRRAAYDQMLIDTGVLDATDFSDRTRRELAARSEGISREASLCRWAAKQAEAPEMRERIEAIMSGPRLSGPQLKELREAYGIELSEIYAAVRINKDVMTAIEADRFEVLPAPVYLKQFLKNLAQILQVDPSLVVARYLEAMRGSRL
ncbi:MAG: helix-turn-helix domain-containing protein [Desulfosarcinaceae bacterium]|jgi:curved DNA-binding protein CbpA